MQQSRWLHKAALQLLLSKLPAGEALNYRLQRQNTDAVRNARRARIGYLVPHIWSLNEHRRIEDASVLEVGAGWDLICSVIFSVLGARQIVACDHVPHARFEIVQQVVEAVGLDADRVVAITGRSREALERKLDSLRSCRDLPEFLRCANIVYKAPSTINDLPAEDASIDIVFSFAVLAHPPADSVAALARESGRVIANGGVVFHYIGMQDSFADWHVPFSNVYFLKHSDALWNFFVSNSINSNNRLRAREHIDLLRQAGARIVRAKGSLRASDVEEVMQMNVARRFRSMKPEELAITELSLIASFDPCAADNEIELDWRDPA